MFTFGRFNPPTTGHEKLIGSIPCQTNRTKNGWFKDVCVSITFTKSKKRPITSFLKNCLTYERKMFQNIKVILLDLVKKEMSYRNN